MGTNKEWKEKECCCLTLNTDHTRRKWVDKREGWWGVVVPLLIILESSPLFRYHFFFSFCGAQPNLPLF